LQQEAGSGIPAATQTVRVACRKDSTAQGGEAYEERRPVCNKMDFENNDALEAIMEQSLDNFAKRNQQGRHDNTAGPSARQSGRLVGSVEDGIPGRSRYLCLKQRQ